MGGAKSIAFRAIKEGVGAPQRDGLCLWIGNRNEQPRVPEGSCAARMLISTANKTAALNPAEIPGVEHHGAYSAKVVGLYLSLFKN